MRAIWKGSLSFGLVNIPVRLYTASQDKDMKFVLLHKKDLSEIRYARICKNEDKEVPWDEIVKGYEYEKGEFVVLQDEDFEKANLKKTKTVEILDFVNESEIDSIYYAKPYFLEPDKNAEGAYNLLREALEKSKKVGLARYVLRNREHIAVIKPYENVIMLNQLRYHNELVNTKGLDVPETKKATSKELEIALKLIDQLTVSFNPEDYKDTYTEEMKEIIEQKAKGKTIHPKTEKIQSTKVHDIMSLLKASLEQTPKKSSSKKKSTKSTPKTYKKTA